MTTTNNTLETLELKSMTVQVSCPYCNAGVALAELPPSGRATCPRCGEAFPVRSLAELGADPDPHLPAASLNGTPTPPPVERPAGWSIGSLALLGITLGVVVFALGLYAIFHKTPRPQPEPAPMRNPAATLPPSALPGLAYLPADTNIAFAAQPGPLLAYAERNHTEPRQIITRAGIPDRLFVLLDQLGLKLEQIDHVVGGLAVTGESVLPRVFVVLTLRNPPADPEAFRKRLKATQFTAPSGATRDKVDLGGLPVEMTHPDGKTYLFASEGKDLDAATSRKGSEHLPASLRESMTKLSPASFAWAATSAERWSEKPSVKAAAALLKQPTLPKQLADLRAAAIGLSLEPELRLTLAARAPDAATANKRRDHAAITLAGQPDVQIGGTGDWATAEAKPQPELWQALKNVLK
jgi:hypothetical protein